MPPYWTKHSRSRGDGNGLLGSKLRKHTFVVDKNVYPQTTAVIRGRAEGLGINVIETDLTDPTILESNKADLIGVLVQYPCKGGQIIDYSALSNLVHSFGGHLSVWQISSH
jgi:glycine dehydrogenase